MLVRIFLKTIVTKKSRSILLVDKC